MATTDESAYIFDPARYRCCRQCCEYIEDKVEVCPFCRRDPMKIRRYSSSDQRGIRVSQKERLLRQLSEGRHVNLDEYLEFAPPTGNNILHKMAYFTS